MERKSKLLREIKKNIFVKIGIIIFAFFLLVAFFAPIFAPNDPIEQNLSYRLGGGFWVGNYKYLLGTDSLGRCILSRIIYGARISLLVGVLAVIIMFTLGTTLGLLSGYLGGKVDSIIMRFTDILMSFPYILLAIAIMAALGPGIGNAMIALGVTGTPRIARLVRGSVLSIKEEEYVEAARSLGVPLSRILLKHILPNLFSTIMTVAFLRLGSSILYIASLGFLGLGVQPPTPEWGAMISEGKDYFITGRWWVATFPGLCITIATLGFVFLGQGLRDILDPRLKGKA